MTYKIGDQCFQQPNRTIVFVSFIRIEFDTPRFELAVHEFSRTFPDVSVHALNIIHIILF